MRFSAMISDRDLTDEDRIDGMMLWFCGEIPDDIPGAVQALTDFYRAGESESKGQRRATGGGKSPCFDYAFDASYLYAAFRECYGMDLLRIPYLHWWEFRWLFNGLPEDCTLVKRIGIRATDLNQIKIKEERARIRKQQIAIAIPQELTDGEIGSAFEALI